MRGSMEIYPRTAAERAMKLQEVLLRATTGKIKWSRSVFERYAIVAQSDIKDAMLKLEAQGTVTSAAAQADVEAESRVN